MSYLGVGKRQICCLALYDQHQPHLTLMLWVFSLTLVVLLLSHLVIMPVCHHNITTSHTAHHTTITLEPSRLATTTRGPTRQQGESTRSVMRVVRV